MSTNVQLLRNTQETTTIQLDSEQLAKVKGNYKERKSGHALQSLPRKRALLVKLSQFVLFDAIEHKEKNIVNHPP